MARITYRPKGFTANVADAIRKANQVCAFYRSEYGMDLTLRQLYYQFVARGWLENTDRNYKNLGNWVNDARLAGQMDWGYIVDRTRNVRSVSHWDTPQDIMRGAASSYRLDKWSTQPNRVEVWVEKDAMVGVLEDVCADLDVPFFSCRGYTSQSELWAAAQRLRSYQVAGQMPVVIHLGDHDPSGIDMTRDIRERLEMFTEQDWLNASDTLNGSVTVGAIREDMRAQGAGPVLVERIALTMDQIEERQPPPNPTKLTDSRAPDYVAQYGYESWELDALDPAFLADLVRDAVAVYRNDDLYADQERKERKERALLNDASRQWKDLVAHLAANPPVTHLEH